MMPKPRQISAALPDVTARKAGDWLRGDRSPSVVDLARILEAFPDIDAREFIVALAIRRAVKLDRFSRQARMKAEAEWIAIRREQAAAR
tara:strand:+ start:222 stop:488 length:267 start_codon:yes stop_codon:yes gene_type:complete